MERERAGRQDRGAKVPNQGKAERETEGTTGTGQNKAYLMALD